MHLLGHIGIAKYLLDQPGVNINEVNDNGDSILLSMMKEGSDNTLDENFVQQIEELVSFGYFQSELVVLISNR
jgi:hypothetical protein